MSIDSPTIPQGRCFHHPAREAVARCPVCEHFYCRECITEHDDRVICSSCLLELTGQDESVTRRRRFAWFGPIVQVACSLLVGWLVFYTAGRLLLRIPSSFHEGTLWKADASSD